MSVQKPAPVRKHLMTPGQPRQLAREPMSLGTVQKWVLSTLAASTILHLSSAVVLSAAFSDKPSSQIGLLVIAAAFGLIAMVVALLIHQHRLLSPWLLIGFGPVLTGCYFIYLR